MSRPSEPEPIADADSDASLWVAVERSGGFAGVVRRWSVSTDEGDHRWRLLVDSCPWDDASAAPEADAPDPGGRVDRFSWAVTARCAGHERRAELSEEEAAGPWRTLIDAVREASAAPPEDA